MALFSVWFLSERVTWLDWVSVAVVLAGMALFFREGLASTSLVGDLLAVLSGITMAWMTLFMRKQKAASPLESILLGNIIAAVVGVPFAFGQPSPEMRGWIGLLLLGLLQIGLSYILYARAIKYVPALETVLVSTIEPILNPIWVLFLVGEKPNTWALIGGALVVLAITGRGALHALGLDAARPKALARQRPNRPRAHASRHIPLATLRLTAENAMRPKPGEIATNRRMGRMQHPAPSRCHTRKIKAAPLADDRSAHGHGQKDGHADGNKPKN